MRSTKCRKGSFGKRKRRMGLSGAGQLGGSQQSTKEEGQTAGKENKLKNN